MFIKDCQDFLLSVPGFHTKQQLAKSVNKQKLACIGINQICKQKRMYAPIWIHQQIYMEKNSDFEKYPQFFLVTHALKKQNFLMFDFDE